MEMLAHEEVAVHFGLVGLLDLMTDLEVEQVVVELRVVVGMAGVWDRLGGGAAAVEESSNGNSLCEKGITEEALELISANL